MAMIAHYLEKDVSVYHVVARGEYNVEDNGTRIGEKITRDIFLIYEDTDRDGMALSIRLDVAHGANFNANDLKMALTSMFGNANTSTRFPLAYAFIPSESATALKFIAQQLTKYVSYDCRQPAMIVADFFGGLGETIAGLANHIHDGKIGGSAIHPGLPDFNRMTVEREGEGYEDMWHASEAIKRRLIQAGKYDQARREELMKLVTLCIHSPTAKE